MKRVSYEEAALRMYELTSRSHTLREIVDLGEDLLGTPCAFSNSAFHHRARSRSYPQSDLDQRNRWLEEHSPEVYYEAVRLQMEQTPDNTPYICAAENTVPRYFCKGFINGKHVGHVTVPQVNIPLSELDTDVIQVICNACSTTYAIESVSYAFDSYFLPEISVVEALYYDEFENPYEFDLYSSQYTFSNYRYFRGAFITGKGISNLDFKLALSNNFNARGLKHWLFASDNALIMLLGADTEDKITDDALAHTVRATFDHYEIRSAISDVFTDLLQAKRHIDFAKRIVLHLDGKTHPTHMMLQEECKTDLFFHDVSQSLSDAKQYCAKALYDIEYYDREKGTNYYQTLYQYLQCGLSPTKTAKKMFFHKNTILYRIKKINELFGISLGDISKVYKLMLSFDLLNCLRDK